MPSQGGQIDILHEGNQPPLAVTPSPQQQAAVAERTATPPAPVAPPHDTESESVTKSDVSLTPSAPAVDANVATKEANQGGQVAPRNVLQAAIDAHGGEKLAAATSITFTSRVTESNGKIHTVQSIYDFDGGSLREVWTETILGFKKETTYIVSPAGAWDLTDGKVIPINATWRTYFNNKLQVMRATFFKLPADQYFPIDGQRDSTGNPASALKVRIDDNTDLILLLDPKTSLVYEHQMIQKQGGRIVHLTVLLGDFREFDGVKMATSQRTQRDGKDATEIVITAAKLSGTVDQNLFRKPSSNTTGFRTTQIPANQTRRSINLRSK